MKNENVMKVEQCILYLCHNLYMKIALFQVDAFTDIVFSENPAAVCHLDQCFSRIDLLHHLARNQDPNPPTSG
jgi:hypothetical protein